jgi:hypothetical protein
MNRPVAGDTLSEGVVCGQQKKAAWSSISIPMTPCLEKLARERRAVMASH